MKRTLIVSLTTVCLAKAQSAGAERLRITRDTFDVSRASGVKFREAGGRSSLCFERGVALVRKRRLPHGVLAVDVRNSQHRHFADLVFRAKDAGTHESAYLRMHKSRQPDTMQYTPHINGETNWQLYGSKQATADLGAGDWVTLRVAFCGDKARVSAQTSRGSFDLRVNDLALDQAGSRFGVPADGEARPLGCPGPEA